MGNYHARFYEGLGRGDTPSLLSSGNNSQFVFDGYGQNTKITELSSGTVTSTKQFIWCGRARCEARNASGTLTNQYFNKGETIAGSNYFYTQDHLRSIKEITNTSGALQAQYDYDASGRQQTLVATVSSDFAYAGYYVHTPSALALTPTRAYAPNLGRWINRDSLGEAGGINLYAYTKNSPVSHRDPTGKSCDCNGEPCGWGNGYLWGNDHYGYPLQPPDDGDEPPDDGDEDPPNIIGAGPLNCRDKCFNARMRCLARCKTLPPEKREDCFSNCRAKYFRCIAACKDKGQ